MNCQESWKRISEGLEMICVWQFVHIIYQKAELFILEEICSFIVSCKDIKDPEEEKKKKGMEAVQPQEEIPDQG